jgi:hypothetical protein
MKRNMLFCITMTFVGLLFFPSFSRGEWKPLPDGTTNKILRAAEKQAVDWLIGKMVPNSTVLDPAPDRRRLMLSYTIPEDDPVYQYLFSRSFTYDDAIGAIAFTMTENYREAEFVLSAMSRVIRSDGSFWFVYNTHNSWPNEDDHEGSMVRTGATAWAGYAFTFYLKTRIREDAFFLEEDPIAGEYLEKAESIARYMLNHRVSDPSDMRHGLVTGGEGTYKLILQDTGGRPMEQYDESSVSWVSTEHNIDSYFFLKDLALLTNKSEYKEAAQAIHNGLFRIWSDKYGQFYRGIRSNHIDKALPLDCASWGALFLFSAGDTKRANRCIETSRTNFFSEHRGITGYKPYYRGPLYDDEEVNSYYSGRLGTSSWKDIDLVWGEGSFGVASAQIKAGNPEAALTILESLLPTQVGGGFRYSTVDIPYQFSTYPSVASTAWFVITVESLLDRQKNSLFWEGGIQ